MRDVMIEIPNAGELMRRMQETLSAVSVGVREKAISRCINRTLTAIGAEAGRIAKERYTAKPKKLFDVMDIRKAVRGGMMGRILIGGKPGLSLIHFKARPNQPGRRPRAGVTAQVKKGGQRRVYGKPGFDKPFVMRKAQGGFGVFVRKHGSRTLEMLLGASPPQALGSHEAEDRLQSKAAQVFMQRLNHEINVLIAGIVK